MNSLTVFATQLTLSLIVFGLLAKWVVTPWLKTKPVNFALMALIFPHGFRHVGLSFLVPGLVDEKVPTAFTLAAAYGDFVSGLFALLCLIALKKQWALTIPLVWIFNVVGSIDLLNALSHADAVPYLNTMWYVPTFFVPLLLVTHTMIFKQLLNYSKSL